MSQVRANLYEAPPPHRPLVAAIVDESLLLVVAEVGAKQPAEQVIRQKHQNTLIKLECVGKLALHLEHHIQPLNENRRTLLRLLGHAVAAAVVEFVSEGAPVLLDQHREAAQRAVIPGGVRGPGARGWVGRGVGGGWDDPHVRVQQQLRRAADLRGAVPPVTAVHQHRGTFKVELLLVSEGRNENENELSVPRHQHPTQ